MRTSVRRGAGQTRLRGPRLVLGPAVVLVLVACGSLPESAAWTGRSAPRPRPTAGTAPGPAPATLPPLTPARPPFADSVPKPDRTTDVSPAGDLPGWKQVFMEDFSAGDVPLGASRGRCTGAVECRYKDGTPDTAGKANGGKSGYYPSKCSASETGPWIGTCTPKTAFRWGRRPCPGFPTPAPTRPGRTACFTAATRSVTGPTRCPGFKTAWLLWPDSGVWPRDGEIDFPEGDLGLIIHGRRAFHRWTPRRFEQFFTEKSTYEWHVATMEWRPGQLEFFLDGVSIGVSTTGVPSTPMHFILQTESCLTRLPRPRDAGHVYLDWISIWVPA